MRAGKDVYNMLTTRGMHDIVSGSKTRGLVMVKQLDMSHAQMRKARRCCLLKALRATVQC